MHDIAKTTNAETDWSVFRNIRNTYIKSVRATKAQYYSQKLTIKNKHISDDNTNININNNDTKITTQLAQMTLTLNQK